MKVNKYSKGIVNEEIGMVGMEVKVKGIGVLKMSTEKR